MENASKALIIAGSILVAILLISVAVLIMNSTGNTQQTVEDFATDTAAQTFNARFTPYEGTAVSAAQVRSLINAANSAKASNRTVTITFTQKNGAGTALSASTLLSTDSYNVTLTYTNGYVSGATVKGPKT